MWVSTAEYCNVIQQWKENCMEQDWAVGQILVIDRAAERQLGQGGNPEGKVPFTLKDM